MLTIVNSHLPLLYDVIIFEIVVLFSVDFVFSSVFSSSELQAVTKPSISPTVSWESLKKCILFVESRGWRGEGKRRRKTTSRIIKVEVVFLLLCNCPLPIHPSLSTLPRVKQFCCCLVDYQSRPALPCTASQGKKKTFFLAKTSLSLCDSRATGFPPKSSWKSQSLRHRSWPNRKWNLKSIFCLQNKLSVCTSSWRYFDPARSKPWRGPFRKSNRIRFAKPPYHIGNCSWCSALHRSTIKLEEKEVFLEVEDTLGPLRLQCYFVHRNQFGLS